MGRYYSGSISGKFWFGVQCSWCIVDIIEKGCELKNKYIEIDENVVAFESDILSYKYDLSWTACGCAVDGDFCNGCYNTKEEHIEADLEAENEPLDKSDCGVIFTIHYDSIPYLTAFCSDLEKNEYFLKVNNNLEFNIDDVGRSVEYDLADYDIIDDSCDEKTVANYCFAKQILKYFELYNCDCEYSAEM